MKAFCVVLLATAVFFAGANARPRSGPTHLEKRKRDVSLWGNEFQRPRYDSEIDVPYQYRDGRPTHLPVVPKISDFDDTEQREPGWDFDANDNYIREQPYPLQDMHQQDEYEDQSVSLDEDDDDVSMDDNSVDDEDYYSDEDDSHMDEEFDQDVSQDDDQDQDQDPNEDAERGSFSAENKGMDSRDQSDGAGVINPRVNFPSYPDRRDSENSFMRSFSPRGQRRVKTRENYQRTSDLCIAVCSALERDVMMNSAQDRAWCGCPVYGVLYKK